MEELVFKFLEKKDIDDIYDLTSEVYEGIENKEIFSQDSKEELEALIAVSYTHLTLPTNREV